MGHPTRTVPHETLQMKRAGKIIPSETLRLNRPKRNIPHESSQTNHSRQNIPKRKTRRPAHSEPECVETAGFIVAMQPFPVRTQSEKQPARTVGGRRRILAARLSQRLRRSKPKDRACAVGTRKPRGYFIRSVMAFENAMGSSTGTPSTRSA